MEFKQLEAFVAVVDYGSFSEAARKLYLTQPTISAHVRSLEEELHTRLILRTTKKTTITTRGYQLYDSAVRMLEDVYKRQVIRMLSAHSERNLHRTFQIGISNCIVCNIEKHLINDITDTVYHYRTAIQ